MRSRRTGYFAMVLVASFPLYLTCGRSCGFESLNYVLLAAVFLALVHWSETRTWAALELVAWTAALAAQCRYESVAMLAAAGVVAAAQIVTGGLPTGARTPAWRWAALPFTLVPLWWQRRATSVINAGDKLDSAFGLEYVTEHLRSAVDFFFGIGANDVPASAVVSAFAVTGVILLLIRLHRANRAHVWATLAFGGGTALIFGAHMAYYMGNLVSPVTARYALSYLLPVALASAVAVDTAWSWRPARLALAAVLAANAAVGLRVAQTNDFGEQLLLGREYGYALGFVQGFDPDSTFIVADRPGMYAAQGYGAVDFGWLEHNKQMIVDNIDRHLYRDAFAIQSVRFDDGTAFPALSGAFKATPVLERQTSAAEFLRISRLEPARGH
jgi:hypothetical protein